MVKFEVSVGSSGPPVGSAPAHSELARDAVPAALTPMSRRAFVRSSRQTPLSAPRTDTILVSDIFPRSIKIHALPSLGRLRRRGGRTFWHATRIGLLALGRTPSILELYWNGFLERVWQSMANWNAVSIAWLLISVQSVGLVSAWLARLTEGSRNQTSCQLIFLACLALVGVCTIFSLFLTAGAWLFSGATLGLMVVAAVCDFSGAAAQELG